MSDNLKFSEDGNKARRTGKGTGHDTSVALPKQPKTKISHVQILGKHQTNKLEELTEKAKLEILIADGKARMAVAHAEWAKKDNEYYQTTKTIPELDALLLIFHNAMKKWAKEQTDKNDRAINKARKAATDYRNSHPTLIDLDKQSQEKMKVYLSIVKEVKQLEKQYKTLK